MSAASFTFAGKTASSRRSFVWRLVFPFMLVLLAGWSWWLWKERPSLWRSHVNILLVRPAAEAAEGLSASQRLGFCEVVAEHLVYRRDVTLLEPADKPQDRSPSDSYIIELRPRREGSRISASFRWKPLSGTGGWNEVQCPALLPKEALEWMLAHMPFDVPGGDSAHLLPENHDAFWDFLNLMHASLSGNAPIHSKVLARTFTEAEPRCVPAWRVRGYLAYLQIIDQSNRDMLLHQEAESSLRKAMELAPMNPMTADLYSGCLSDLGNHAAALEVLGNVMKHYPRNAKLAMALTYSARNAGLLDLAQKSLARETRLLGTVRGVENTYLYLGDIAQFETSIRQETTPSNQGRDFYLGYIALLREDRNAAIEHFRTTDYITVSSNRFARLRYVFGLACQGKTEEAKGRLEFLFGDQFILRAPDGEFTFKLAEASALAGSQNRAMDLASRAAAQGFGCTRWYEKSPFLESIRQSPRYQALLRILRERQAPLERKFPPKAFGL